MIAILACSAFFALSANAAGLSLEERIEAQRAIERVYWAHRLWPLENPGPKPSFDAIMGDDILRAMVEDYLEESNALEAYWGRPITAVQLQAEVDRMAANTRDPSMLRELFAALKSDPVLIAECLARPVLADRLIRGWYAKDERFHGVIRRRAEQALASTHDLRAMQVLGAHYSETTWEKDGPEANSGGVSDIVLLDSTEWQELVARLSTLWDTETLESLPIGRVSEIREDDAGFAVAALLERGPDSVTVATASWNKVPFDSWWQETRAELEEDVPALNGFVLSPVIGATEGTCTDDEWTDTLQDVPDGRRGHTAVWTGSEMIVWGGQSDGSIPASIYWNSGGRYDPATDTWTMITREGAPSGRSHHTAVWTGTEMIVWGGTDCACSPQTGLDTGGRYNPTTDSWSPTSIALSGRQDHSAVWTGTEMIVWSGSLTNTGGRYDPVSDTWGFVTITDAPAPRSSHSAVWTGSEMIVWGGEGITGDRLGTGGRYDPSQDMWSPTSTTGRPGPRKFHTAVWTGTQMIVWGGWNGGSYNTGGRYDPSSDSWLATTITGAPHARAFHTAVWTGSEMIVWGGEDWGVSSVMDTGGRYDPSTDSWTATPTTGAPPARRDHAAVWTGDEMIVWGGATGETRSGLTTGGRYDPPGNSWIPTSTGTVPLGRYGRMVWTGSEMIVWGDGPGSRYDPALATWTPTSTTGAPSSPSGHSVVWTGSEMIVWGGEDNGGSPTNSGARYDPGSDTWSATSTVGAPPPRESHTAVWTGTEMIVWGGQDAPSHRVDTGGRYDPSGDSWIATPVYAAPSARWGHSAVWTGTEMIVWGGDLVTGRTDTGVRFDPGSGAWTPTSTVGAPSARQYHPAIWTGSRMVVWGGDAAGKVNTGGRYDPVTDSWEPTTTIGVPSARWGHSAVWTGIEMIVWGGVDSSGYVASGGRYNPTLESWSTTSVAGAPVGRSGHGAVWTGSEMIVWGGHPTEILGGGEYCACSTPAAFYLDADGDGFGTAAVAVTACAGPPPAGYASLSGDCNDDDRNMYPGAPEVNDHLDNQCPGDHGYDLVDEISGQSGFHNPADETEFSWPDQVGATSYEVARSSAPDFSSDCIRVTRTSAYWNDPETPGQEACFFYLVRALTPYEGSWGEDSTGAERTDICRPNLVEDGGVESWDSPADLSMWAEGTNAGPVDQETDPGYVYEGSSAARLTRTGSGVVNIRQSGIPLVPGADYRLELAAMFSEALSGALQVRIRNVTRGEDLQDNGSWSTATNFIGFDLTTSYQSHALDFTVDAGYDPADDYRLIIRQNNATPTPIGSEMWIDDVAIH